MGENVFPSLPASSHHTMISDVSKLARLCCHTAACSLFCYFSILSLLTRHFFSHYVGLSVLGNSAAQCSPQQLSAAAAPDHPFTHAFTITFTDDDDDEIYSTFYCMTRLFCSLTHTYKHTTLLVHSIVYLTQFSLSDFCFSSFLLYLFHPFTFFRLIFFTLC